MQIIDVTLRESVYYESGLSYRDRLRYLEALCENIPNDFVPYVEISFIDNDVVADLNYDEAFIKEAYEISKNKFRLVSMIHPGKADPAKWNKDVIRLFDMVRIMVPLGKMESTKEYIQYFHALGVKVACNVLYAASAPLEEILKMEKQADEFGADYFYCADSSGSFTPAYTAELCRALIANKGGLQLGLHLHDHMRMALANALIAEACGIELTDVSVTGAGKGGGNMKMEEALLHLYDRERITAPVLTNMRKMFTEFNRMVSKDNAGTAKAFRDFLVGVYKLNLKDIERVETAANGDDDRYFAGVLNDKKA